MVTKDMESVILNIKFKLDSALGNTMMSKKHDELSSSVRAPALHL